MKLIIYILKSSNYCFSLKTTVNPLVCYFDGSFKSRILQDIWLCSHKELHLLYCRSCIDHSIL